MVAWRPARTEEQYPIRELSRASILAKGANLLVSKICSRRMIPSPPQSLVPLGVFNSSLAGAISGFVFLLGVDVVKLLAATSKPALLDPNRLARLAWVTARTNGRGVGAFTVGRARDADLLKLASVTIRIHVEIQAGSSRGWIGCQMGEQEGHAIC